ARGPRRLDVLLGRRTQEAAARRNPPRRIVMLTPRAGRSRLASLVVLGLLALAVAVAPAEPQKEPPEAKKDDPEKLTEAEEQHRREAEKVVGEIELEMLVGDKWTKVKQIEKPLLFFSDATRANDRGSAWGWGDRGRPLAL